MKTKATWGRKVLFHLTLPQYYAFMKSGIGTQTGQELGDRRRCRDQGITYWLLPLTCLACSLLEPRTASPGMTPPTTGCALSHQSQIKYMPFMLAYSLILWRQFLSLSSFHSDDSSLCQVDIKPASTSTENDLYVTYSICILRLHIVYVFYSVILLL